MAGHQGAEAQVVVDIFIAVEVANLAALPFLYENRIRIIGSIVAGHAERNTLQRPQVCFRGFGRALLVDYDFFL